MKGRFVRRLTGLLALLNLAIGLAAAVLVFLGRIPERTYRTAFLLSSIAWFIFAAFWTAGRNKPGEN